MKPCPEKGFTLMELMVTIAVIAVLAAVAIPNYLKGRDQAKFSNCVEALKGIQIAEEMFITVNGTYTTDSALLGEYIKGQAPACAAGVYCSVQRACGAPWDITPGGSGNMNSYYLKATAGDRFNCKICMSSGGYLPTDYKSCMKRSPQECPGM